MSVFSFSILIRIHRHERRFYFVHKAHVAPEQAVMNFIVLTIYLFAYAVQSICLFSPPCVLFLVTLHSKYEALREPDQSHCLLVHIIFNRSQHCLASRSLQSLLPVIIGLCACW